VDSIGTSALDTVEQLLQTLRAQLPSILGAVLLVVAGWLVARLLRLVAARGMQVAEALIDRVTGRSSRLGERHGAQIVGTVVFWIVLLFFFTAATQVLGLTTFTAWLGRLLDYLPTLAAGALIIAAGLLLSRFVGDLAFAAAKSLPTAQRAALGRLAQGVTLAAAILVGADQVGIRVTWIAVLTLIVLGCLLGGVALAVSLGARGYIANLIGAHYLRQSFQVGETIRVQGFEGRILAVTASTVVLETAGGRVSIPARVFHEESIVLVRAPHE
jgi:hypothetical protein